MRHQVSTEKLFEISFKTGQNQMNSKIYFVEFTIMLKI